MRYEKELMGSSSLRDALADVPRFDDALSKVVMKAFEHILSTGSYPQSGLPAFVSMDSQRPDPTAYERYVRYIF